tara:strand:- start:162 stop:428 length:267 start_codon:yes stop_codon:yes gene_type:complete
MKRNILFSALLSATVLASSVSMAEGASGDKDQRDQIASGEYQTAAEQVVARLSPMVDPERLKMLRFLAQKLCGNMQYDDEVFVERAKK